METRRRGHSFYEEENDDVIQVRVKGGSPSPDRSKSASPDESRDIDDADLLDFDANLDTSHDSDEGSSAGTDPTAYTDTSFDNVSPSSDQDEVQEDPQPRGRGRSRSMCTHLIDPSNLPVAGSSTEGGHLGDSRGGDEEPDDEEQKRRSKSADRVGPLTQHEVQVLKKGLEDATKVPNRNELQEEEEEIRAAKAEEEERLVMAGKHGPGKLSGSADDKPGTGSLSSSSVRSFFSRDKGNATRAASTDSTGAGAGAGAGDSAGASEGLRLASQEVAASSSAPLKTSSPTFMQKYTLGSENNNMRRFKILLLGDSGVGKSSLILRWTEDRYLATLTGTVGVNFKSKKVTIDEEAVHIQVWDTAGQQQFHKITTSYYRGAHGIMVVYDVSDPESLANVEYWIKNIKTHASPSVRLLLVGNKTDLRAKWLAAQTATSARSNDETLGSDKHRGPGSSLGSGSTEGDEEDEDDESHAALAVPAVCSDYRAGREVADKFEIPYFETSALDANGTHNAFMNIARFCVGIEDGNKSLLVPTGDASQLLAGAAHKPSMISRMMGRGAVAQAKAAPAPPPRARMLPPATGSAAAAAGKPGPEKKKCTMQ